MNSSEIERFIDIISDDEIEISTTLSNKEPVELVLQNPTPKIKAKAASLYQREFKKSKGLGLPTEDEAIQQFIKLNRWSQQDEDQIKGLKDDINKIRRGLIDLFFRKDMLEKSRSLLRRAEMTLMKKITQRHELLTGTAQNQALIVQQRYIISQITLTQNGDKFWPTTQIFDSSIESKLIDKLCMVFFRTSKIDTKIIREIARSNIWRSMWSSCQKSGNPFGKSVIDLSFNQRDLVHWSCIYDGVYEAYERPTSDIIEDDDVLDSWFMKQGEKIENRSRKQFGEDSLPTPKFKRAGGRNEQFIICDADGAKDVYKMNDPGARNVIRRKQAIVNEKQSVKEQYMPDSQNEMRQIAMNQSRKHALRKK